MTHVGWLAGYITACSFNWLGQYASNPVNTSFCYTELTFLVVEVAYIDHL